MRGPYLVYPHVAQRRRDTRPKIPIFHPGFGLTLLVDVLRKPAVYQVIQLHICIESKTVMHFLFKLICPAAHFLFQLAPGKGAGAGDLLAVAVVAIRHAEQVRNRAASILPFHNLSHFLTPP